jgi:preprotein translocase subunit YajC
VLSGAPAALSSALAVHTATASAPTHLAASQSSGGGAWIFLIPLLLLGFLMLRGSRARSRQAQQVTAGLAPGARVVTTAGLFATVVDLEESPDRPEKVVLLEIAPGVVCRFNRTAIVRVLPDDLGVVPAETTAQWPSERESDAADRDAATNSAIMEQRRS